MCQFRRSDEDLCEDGPILECQVCHGRDMAAGNDQDMILRPGVDVLKSHYVLVLVDDFTGDLAGCDLAEQAVLLPTISSNYLFLGIVTFGIGSHRHHYRV